MSILTLKSQYVLLKPRETLQTVQKLLLDPLLMNNWDPGGRASLCVMFWSRCHSARQQAASGSGASAEWVLWWMSQDGGSELLIDTWSDSTVADISSPSNRMMGRVTYGSRRMCHAPRSPPARMKGMEEIYLAQMGLLRRKQTVRKIKEPKAGVC